MPSGPRRWSPAGSAPATRCGVAWGGGETPALAGIVESGRIDLAAPCTGIVSPKARLSLGEHLAPGDAIVLLGIERHPRQRPEPGAQARRATAAGLPRRRSAERRADLRRRAARADGPLFAGHRGAPRAGIRAALLRQHHRPRLAQAAAPPRGARLPHPHRCPRCRRCWRSSSEHAGLDDREAYSTFNMGAGFALFVAADDAERAVAVARKAGRRGVGRRQRRGRPEAKS